MDGESKWLNERAAREKKLIGDGNAPVSAMTLFDRLPEELLVEEDNVRGLVVRLHNLGWFRIEMVAVVVRGEDVTVVRREAEVGPRGIITPKVEDRFACSLCYLAKLDKQLVHLGISEVESFIAEDVLDGVSLACRYRAPLGTLHQVHLFCWGESSNPEVRRLGDFLQKFARSSLRLLRWQARLSRLW